MKGNAVPDTNYCHLCQNSCTEELPIWSVGRENISFLVKYTLFENLYHSHPDICLGFLRNPNLSDACNPTSCILVLINWLSKLVMDGRVKDAMMWSWWVV